MSSEFPLVSIVIPCYNVEEFLRETLESALGQTYPHLEVIAVDDGSTDATAAILREYADRYPQLRLVLRRVNHGLCRTRNEGYAHARGQYLLWLDADDCLTPGFVEALVSAAVQAPGAIVAGPWRRLRLKGGVWTPEYRVLYNSSAEEVWQQTLRGGWPLHCMACLFPREAVDALGGWDVRLVMHEDRLFLSLLLLRRFPMVFVQSPEHAVYRIRANSLAVRRTEAVARASLLLAQIVERELHATGAMGRYANDFAHFLDLYYIDSLPGYPALAAEFLAMRQRVCPQYRDLRSVPSRLVRALAGDHLFARLAVVLGVDRKR